MHSYVGDKVETIVSDSETQNILNMFKNKIVSNCSNSILLEQHPSNDELLYIINFIQEQQFANIIALERIRTLIKIKTMSEKGVDTV